MAGCASSTTQFYPCSAAEIGPQFAEQYAKFSQFAAANEVLPVPQFGTHDVRYKESTPQCYMRWLHPITSEPFDISVNLQLDSNNEDPDMAELRVFWGLSDHLVVGWTTWNNRTIEIGTPPAAPARTSPIGLDRDNLPPPEDFMARPEPRVKRVKPEKD